MIVLGVLSVICFYILFERNYMIRKAGKEDPMFMERIKDYIHSEMCIRDRQYDELKMTISNDSLSQLLEQEQLKTQRLLEELRTVKSLSLIHI